MGTVTEGLLLAVMGVVAELVLRQTVVVPTVIEGRTVPVVPGAWQALVAVGKIGILQRGKLPERRK